ncbi:MAG: protein kinase [Deltaproteobacteria bacterium]|nr:protein kinase [Deltaproteobacteria bacterium]
MAAIRAYLNTILGVLVAALFLVLSYTGPGLFESLEKRIGDGSGFLAGEDRGPATRILVIEIDKKSLIGLGAWPWSRDVLARMVDTLRAAEVRLIALQVPLFEKSSGQGIKEIRAFRERFRDYTLSKKEEEITEWVLENLGKLEEGLDSDRTLVEAAEKSGNVLLATFSRFYGETNTNRRLKESVVAKNFLSQTRAPESVKNRPPVTHMAIPFLELAEAALGMGYSEASPNGDGVGRGVPIFVAYRDSLLPTLPLRMAIAYLGMQPKQVFVEGNQVRLKGYSIPIHEGEVLLRYPRSSRNEIPRYSFVEILEAKKLPPALKGSVVVVGFGVPQVEGPSVSVSAGSSDPGQTALCLDALLKRSYINRPPSLAYAEMLAVVLMGALATFLMPRVGPLNRLLFMLAATILVIAAGMVLFAKAHLWFKSVYVAGCLVAEYIVLSVSRLFVSERVTKESIETNRLLGLSFQSQGLLDLAFDKFKKLPMDLETRDLIYNLGIEYEQKRLINKALEAYECANKGGGFRDLNDRIPRLKESDKSSTLGSHAVVREGAVLETPAGDARASVGRYEILGELGKGSMGIVYKALDPKINRMLAIKTIRFSDEFDDDVIQEIKERFFREAEIAGQLSHPSIVIIYDVGEDGELTFMAMEFLEGDDLENFITKKNLLPFRQVLDIVASVAGALDYAHKHEVIHRDIKPANIMLLKGGGVKVTDFGIAKAISSSRTKTGVILGTPNYMSPEQIMGQKIDHRSDIFSLGVLFFQLLTGETPFHGDNLSSLLYQITQVKHPSIRGYNPKIPKVCEQIIDKALAKNPDGRFKTAGELEKYVRLLSSKIDQLRRKKSE